MLHSAFSDKLVHDNNFWTSKERSCSSHSLDKTLKSFEEFLSGPPRGFSDVSVREIDPIGGDLPSASVENIRIRHRTLKFMDENCS